MLDRHMFAAAAFLLVLLQCGCSVNISTGSRSHTLGTSRSAPQRDDSPNLEIALPQWDAPVAASSVIPGTWKATGKWWSELGDETPKRPLQVQFRSESKTGAQLDYATLWLQTARWHVEQGVAVHNVQPIEIECGLSTAQILFRGERRGNKAGGALELRPDEHFLRRAGELLDGQLTIGELLRFGMQPAPLEYIELISTNGNRWTWNEVLHLLQRGVSPEFIVSLRKPAQIAPTNANPEPIQAAIPPRKPFTADDLVLLHSRGVSPAYVEEVDQAGALFTPNDLVLLHSRGVSSAYIHEISRSGLQATASDLTLLSSRGVPSQYVREIRAHAYPYTANALVLIHSRGVSTAYAREMRQAGYIFSANNLVLLHSRGVPASYAAAVANPNFEPLSAEELVRLYSAGVPAENVKRLRK